MPDVFHVRLVEHLRRYFACGGMPDALGRWVETGAIVQVDKVLSDLLDSYERDFAKHGGRAQFAKPVSYTHLDVYKRQAPQRAGRDITKQMLRHRQMVLDQMDFKQKAEEKKMSMSTNIGFLPMNLR